MWILQGDMKKVSLVKGRSQLNFFMENSTRTRTSFELAGKNLGIDTINIAVPTPLRKTKDPDISYIVAALKEIQKYIHKGQLIILESTTYPGTTEEVMMPILEENGLKVGKDFFLAFSPERVDPGNKKYNTKNKQAGQYSKN